MNSKDGGARRTSVLDVDPTPLSENRDYMISSMQKGSEYVVGRRLSTKENLALPVMARLTTALHSINQTLARLFHLEATSVLPQHLAVVIGDFHSQLRCV